MQSVRQVHAVGASRSCTTVGRGAQLGSSHINNTPLLCHLEMRALSEERGKGGGEKASLFYSSHFLLPIRVLQSHDPSIHDGRFRDDAGILMAFLQSVGDRLYHHRLILR